MAYLNELEAEVTRLRMLCAETTDKLAVLVSHLNVEARPDLMVVVSTLHLAAHGRPFTLRSDKE